MVKALLEGQKTQTRRVLKPQPKNSTEKIVFDTTWHFSQIKCIGTSPNMYEVLQSWKCPYGEIGDVLWVRETIVDDQETGWIYKDGEPCNYLNQITFQNGRSYIPSIYMPFDAARIFLEIIDIRVERLQDISDNDAIAEGIAEQDHKLLPKGWKDYMDDHIGVPFTSPKGSFRSLWKSINGLDSWDANPWVWVIEFKRINKPTT